MQIKSIPKELRKVLVHSLKAIEDVLVSMFPQAVGLATGLITAGLLARGLGPAGMGQYVLVLSIPTFIVSLSDLGIGQTAIRYASRAAAQGDVEGQFAVLRWAFRLRMMLVLIFALAVFTLAPFLAGVVWHDSTLTGVIQLGLLIGIFGALAHVPTVYFQSIKRFRTNSTIQMAQTLVSFSGIIVIALLHAWRLPFVIGVTVLASGLAAFAFITVTPKSALFKFERSSTVTGPQLRTILATPKIESHDAQSMDQSTISTFARYMALSSILYLILGNADIWLMGILLTKGEIGIYGIATSVTLPLLVLYSAINVALWPRASAVTSPGGVKSLLRTTLQLSLLVTIGSLAYAFFAPFLVPYVFGPLYLTSIFLAQLLCLRYVILIATDPIALIGYNFGLVRDYVWITLIELIVVVGIDVWLLPIVGPMAAALALIAAAALGAALVGLLIWRKMKLHESQSQ